MNPPLEAHKAAAIPSHIDRYQMVTALGHDCDPMSGAAEQEALALVAALLPQTRRFRLALDAFGDDGEAEARLELRIARTIACESRLPPRSRTNE
jgi:hypothetical protein